MLIVELNLAVPGVVPTQMSKRLCIIVSSRSSGNYDLIIISETLGSIKATVLVLLYRNYWIMESDLQDEAEEFRRTVKQENGFGDSVHADFT